MRLAARVEACYLWHGRPAPPRPLAPTALPPRLTSFFCFPSLQIREDPEYEHTTKLDSYPKINEQVPKTYAERKATIAAKKAAMKAALEAAGDDDDEEDEDED